jgi:ATP-binding cassette subfamily B protein
VLCLAAATLASLAIPRMVQRAIDALQADAASARLGGYVGLIVLLALANAIARLGSRFAIIGGAQRIEYDLRNDLFASLETFPPKFYAAHPTGELMSRASSDVAAVRSLVGFGALSLVGTGFAFVGALAAMLAADPWLTLWAMAPYPGLVLLAKRFNGIVNERAQSTQEQLGVLSARVQEYIAGMSVVRAYTLEPRAGAEFARENREYLRRSLALARTQASFAPLMGLIAGVGTLVVLWAGGKAVVDGRLSLGALVAFNGYLAYLAWPTIALGWTLSIVRRGMTSLARIQEIVDAAKEEPVGVGTTLPPNVTTPSVRFVNLTFAYEGRGPALRDVSFEVGAGETVAIVGPTGAGKSTLGLLLARLWEPPPGTVFVGDRDVTTLELGDLRARLGYVQQEGFLFSRPLRENIALGRDGLDEPRVRAAASVAAVAEEIERFPAGYATVVGERGLTLSGGQRQRVALARALVAAPPILVLDDAFASVDAAKEEEIAAGLRRFAAGRTVLLMTHRLRAAQLADRVIVLAEGRVVETGRHSELLSAHGLYARLWRIQQLEEEIARA